jgi:hypothetical protein
MGLFSDVEGNLQEELGEISKKYIPRDCIERVCVVGNSRLKIISEISSPAAGC